MGGVKSAEQSADALTDALHAAWPDGVPEGELMLASRLSAGMRATVASRLKAIMRFYDDHDQRQGVATRRAAEAGVSRKRFYAMARAWMETRSIIALGARAAENRSRASKLSQAVRASAEEMILYMSVHQPDASIAEVCRRVVEATRAPISRTTVRRLWLDARRTAPPGLFSERLLLDSVGLDAFYLSHRLRLYVVIDRGTGLVLGWAIATNDSRAWGHVHAADFAVDELSVIDLAPFASFDGRLGIDLVLQRDDVTGGGVLRKRLAEAGIACEVHIGSVGRRAVEVLGERVGPVWVGSGERGDDVSYRNGRTARMPELTSEMSSELDDAIRAHNRARAAAASEVLKEGAGACAREAIDVLRLLGSAHAELDALLGYSDESLSESLL